MAIVSGNVLGNLSGKLGNLSARTVAGKTILSARPSHYTVSQDPDCVAVRNKFSVTSNFGKYVLLSNVLKEAWDKVKNSGMSVYNTLFKYNFQHSAEDRPTANNIITPGGFSLPVTVAAVGANDITAELDPIDSVAEITVVDQNAEITAVVVYHNPVDPEEEPFKVFNLSKEVANYDFAVAYSLNIPINGYQNSIATKYQDSILYLALSTKDADNVFVQTSATYPVES